MFVQTRKIGQNYILRRFLARIFAALEIFARVSTICAIIIYFWQKKSSISKFFDNSLLQEGDTFVEIFPCECADPQNW